MNTDAANSGIELKNSRRNALALAERLADRPVLLRSLWGMWVSLFMTAERRAALPYAERFLEVALQEPESGEAPIGDRLVAVVAHTLGDQRRALVHIERIVLNPLPPRSHVVRLDFDQRVTALAFYARILWLLGRIDESRAAATECLREAERLDHAPTLFYALANGVCVVAGGLGEVDTLTRVVRQMLATTTKYGPWHRSSLCFDAWLSILNGELDRGTEQLRSALQSKLYKPTFVGTYSALLGVLAEAEGKRGNLEVARATIDEALVEARELEEGWSEPELLRIQAELLVAAGHPSLARNAFEQSLQLAEEQGASYWQLRSATSYARLLRESGEGRRATELLRPILQGFERAEPTPHLAEARALSWSLDASRAS